jgi:hypothetical protein
VETAPGGVDLPRDEERQREAERSLLEKVIIAPLEMVPATQQRIEPGEPPTAPCHIAIITPAERTTSAPASSPLGRTPSTTTASAHVTTGMAERMTWFSESVMPRREMLFSPMLTARKAPMKATPRHCLRRKRACTSRGVRRAKGARTRKEKAMWQEVRMSG